ncbi:hypothetical protein [Fodinibius salsisoli]|uniref:VOC domain-containing protein n=1 Tax=Fodinibius salsisoli TaxID=2820877 RepID=A0ABT3PL67_9BACT|nr:hypothetical protein [Fodinibius salsisoli]MCW9706699.1 hypothetical protein [Fodinibius salsisoli]
MKTFIHTPANNLKDSLYFYRKLNFTVLSEESPTIVSDGTLCIEISTDHFARRGIKLVSQSWEQTINKLKEVTTIKKTDSGYLLSDVSGTWIYLVEEANELNVELPNSKSALGNNMGISIETIDIKKSTEIWMTLGFSRSSEEWPSFTNEDGVTVTFYEPNSCPHLFFNPSLTYFNGDENLQIIEYIRSQQIPITEEITYFNEQGIVDNIVLRDPGGLGFFLFND